jgi:hypothetical protein
MSLLRLPMVWPSAHRLEPRRFLIERHLAHVARIFVSPSSRITVSGTEEVGPSNDLKVFVTRIHWQL